MENVVVVESPAKAKTINKYLGSDYLVLASYGHVRDLPAKDGSVEPDEGFAMIWQVDDRAEKQLREISKAVKGARHLFLATDPDREGEAISWHVLEELARRGALNGVEVKRIVFTEVTKSAVLDAVAHPRAIDDNLVDAYRARRALDYLVGFTLSPVLWRKLPGARSAGRVQSVALRLVCEREAEIEIFKPQEYWTVEVDLETPASHGFRAKLSHLQGKKLEKFDLSNAETAHAAKAAVLAGRFRAGAIERKQIRRHPPPPFTTSTLQQEASRKLHFSAKRTMQVAQRLYEGVELNGETVGLITYMRTDGVQMARVAIEDCRRLIAESYGPSHLPGSPRIYKSTAKNAQEAHEAIRPTDVARRPETIARYLDDGERKLYELIWKRTLASQMESARLDQMGVDIPSSDGARNSVRSEPWSPSTASYDSIRKARTRTGATGRPRSGRCRRWRKTIRSRSKTPTRSATSPSRRPVTPRRAWSGSSRSSASAAPRPTRRFSRCCRSATTCAWRSATSYPRTADASSPHSS